MSCPTCGSALIGMPVLELHARGTGTRVDAGMCTDCGTVSVPEREQERFFDRLEEWVEEEMEDDENQHTLQSARFYDATP